MYLWRRSEEVIGSSGTGVKNKLCMSWGNEPGFSEKAPRHLTAAPAFQPTTNTLNLPVNVCQIKAVFIVLLKRMQFIYQIYMYILDSVEGRIVFVFIQCRFIKRQLMREKHIGEKMQHRNFFVNFF